MNAEFNKDLKKSGILILKIRVRRAKEYTHFLSGMNHLTPSFTTIGVRFFGADGTVFFD